MKYSSLLLPITFCRGLQLLPGTIFLTLALADIFCQVTAQSLYMHSLLLIQLFLSERHFKYHQLFTVQFKAKFLHSENFDNQPNWLKNIFLSQIRSDALIFITTFSTCYFNLVTLQRFFFSNFIIERGVILCTYVSLSLSVSAVLGVSDKI